LRLLLCSADRFNERAIFLGLRDRKTFGFKSNALLCLVTRADQRLFLADFFRLMQLKMGSKAFAILPW